MDFMEQFKEYLVEWCHKKQLPVPKKEWSEYWQLAWKDFTNEVLMNNYDEVNSHYNSIDIVVPHNSINIEDLIDESSTETIEDNNQQESTIETKSDWEIVQELMKKNK